MLKVESKDRIDIAGILSHPWFGSSVQDVAQSVNQGLLDMPESMITGMPSESSMETASVHKLSPFEKSSVSNNPAR